MADAEEVKARIDERTKQLVAQGVPPKRARELAREHIAHEDDVDGTLPVVE